MPARCRAIGGEAFVRGEETAGLVGLESIIINQNRAVYHMRTGGARYIGVAGRNQSHHLALNI
ncbi:hypothetical protein BDN71DRAFT_1458041 [Pleurotus eryngii]|uniref:Uncharacterized protein n=1 Tax=Pleurotus eryngii TaxID=5323 RepID=A0A9P6D1U0_PLEER|nr:hypothetical protein BDN71DRAFT_1458041 [Pleurotus eryngii]